MSLFRTVTLPNELMIEFDDLSNRYFGDYWRVSIEVRCRIAVNIALGESDSEFARARTLFGEEVIYRRTLEKMSVPGNEVEEVRRSLVESFLSNAGPYLSDPSFAERFVRKQLSERKSGTRLFLAPK